MATATNEPVPSTSAIPEKRDFRREVTDRIIRMLEEGVAPWQKPWEPGEATPVMPTNPTTSRAYRGANALHLMATAFQRGYGDPRWMTYQQAARQGWYVRRGEKGTQIEYWEVKAAEERSFGDPPESATTQREGRGRAADGANRVLHRVYTVFNASQIEGVPAWTPTERSKFDVIHSAEQILTGSAAVIIHDQADRAFYDRSSDRIHLPSKDAFRDAAGYYGTALHELAHWTGHPLRLDRVTLNESYRFGDLNYAKEELRAELASLFLAAERGIPHDPAQHAAYVDSWIGALQKDKHEIFRAAHDAARATDFLLALERNHSIADNELSHKDADVPGAARQTLPRETAEAITARTLGETARTLSPATDSGIYRGEIIGVTADHVVQRQTSGIAIAHPKDLLARQPDSGENVSITYSNGKANVKPIRERSNAKGLGR